MARRDPVGPHRHGVVEKSAELDFGVAEDVRIGGAPRTVFAKEVREDALLVFLGEVDGLDVDADHVRRGGCVDEVLTRGAVFRVVVILPVLHEEADDVEALFFEEPGAHGGVDAAREADHNFLTHGVVRANRRSSPTGRIATMQIPNTVKPEL